jgi:hypothetical protein
LLHDFTDLTKNNVEYCWKMADSSWTTAAKHVVVICCSTMLSIWFHSRDVDVSLMLSDVVCLAVLSYSIRSYLLLCAEVRKVNVGWIWI